VIDAHVRGNSVPESAGELCAAVSDDIIRCTMLEDHVFRKHSWQFPRVNVLLAGEVDRHVSQSVDDYQNPNVCRYHWLGKVSDDIHEDSFPRSIGWWQWVIGSVACMVRCFDLVAYLASGKALSYRCIHRRTVEISRYEFSISKDFKVARFGIVIDNTYHFVSERFWYVYPSFEGQGA